MKKYNLIIEPWRDLPGSVRRGQSGFRWRVSWELDGLYYAEGFADSHAEAREAAEAYLIDKGVKLGWDLPERPGS